MSPDAITIINLSILAVALVSGLIGSVVLSARLSKRHPQFKPYAWGYFQGVGGTVAGSLYLAKLLWFEAAPVLTAQPHLIVVFIGLCILIISPCVGIVKRYKIGWIIGTVLTLNPVVWIINGIYAYKRWNELKDISFPIRRRDHPHPAD